MNNYRANYAKLFGRPISAPVRIRDRFTLSVWNFDVLKLTMELTMSVNLF